MDKTTDKKEPQTIWKSVGFVRILHWKCACGMEHPLLEKGKYVLICPKCRAQAGFDIKS